VDRCPESRQTLLFSATLDGTVAKLAARMMRDPQRIEMTSQSDRHANITQTLLYADDAGHKLRLLDHLLRDVSMDQAIIFTATKRGADDLAEHLSDSGFSAMALHGDMNQRQRSRTLSEVQDGRVRVLVATTSPHAALMCRPSATPSTTTCRCSPKITSTASAAPVAPVAMAQPLRWLSTASVIKCAASNTSSATPFRLA